MVVRTDQNSGTWLKRCVQLYNDFVLQKYTGDNAPTLCMQWFPAHKEWRFPRASFFIVNALLVMIEKSHGKEVDQVPTPWGFLNHKATCSRSSQKNEEENVDNMLPPTPEEIEEDLEIKQSRRLQRKRLRQE